MRRLVLMVGGTLAFWLLLAYPAHLIGGGRAVAYSATAMALCVVPAALTLAWAQRALAGSPGEQLTMVLGGTGLRMAFVLGAGLALYLTIPYYQDLGFWVGVLVFYLFTLGWEMVLLVIGRWPSGAA